MCVSGTNVSRDECPQKAHCSVEEAGAGLPRPHREADVTDGLMVPGTCLGPLSRDPSPPQGPLARTAGGGGVSPGRVSSILTVRTHVGRFTHRLSQQETLRGSKLVPSPNIFSGTTMKSCICIFF